MVALRGGYPSIIADSPYLSKTTATSVMDVISVINVINVII
jgi:hypothetical protein